MLFRAHFIMYHLLLSTTTRAIESDDTDEDDKNSNQNARDPLNHTVDWLSEFKWMVERFQQLPMDEHVVFGRLRANLPASQSNSPFLIPVFVVPTESVHSGSIVGDKAIMTACSATVVPMGDVVMMIKAEDVVVVLDYIILDKVTPVMHAITEIRRHPTCSQPYTGGSWKNNVALLLLSMGMQFSPNVMGPINCQVMTFLRYILPSGR
uniref:FO synthase subunit 2 2 n=1 Tax=Lygus hesperus TaxID=30085 RepID=A0A0A9X7R1_LYGHE